MPGFICGSLALLAPNFGDKASGKAKKTEGRTGSEKVQLEEAQVQTGMCVAGTVPAGVALQGLSREQRGSLT